MAKTVNPQKEPRRLSWMAKAWIVIGILVVAEVAFAIYLNETTPPGPKPLSEREQERGKIHDVERFGKPDEAAKAYEAFLTKYPDDRIARRDCVAFYRKNRNPVKALGHAKELVKGDSKNLDDLLFCGDTALEAGVVMTAYQYFKDAQKLAPRDIRTFKGLARTYQAEGQIQLAIASVQKALSIDQNDQEARRLLSTLQNELAQSRMRQPGMPGVPQPRIPQPGIPQPGMPGTSIGDPQWPGHRPPIPTPGVPGHMDPRPRVPRPGAPHLPGDQP